MVFRARESFLLGLLVGFVTLYLLEELVSPNNMALKALPAAPFRGTQLTNLSLAPQVASVRKPPLYWTTEELGVFHYRIPGDLNSSSFGATLHIMVKAIKDDASGMKILGTGFCEQAGPHFTVYDKPKDHMRQPDGMGSKWRPNIALVALSGMKLDFNVTHHKINTPFEMTLDLTPEQVQAMPSADLQVDDWQASFEVSPQRWAQHLKPGSLLQQHRPPPLLGGLKRVVMVQAYMWGRDAIYAAPLVVQSLRYHRGLGVHSFFLYTLGGMMHSLMHHPEVLASIDAGHLRVVDWESQHARYKSIFTITDQSQFLTHAVLAHHNEDVLLLMVDLDEVLVSFKPLAPPQLSLLMQGMLRGKHTEVVLSRVNSMCWDCHGTQQNPVVAAEGGMPLELSLWANSDLSNRSDHPLFHYPFLPVDEHKQLVLKRGGKAFVDPNTVHSYGVHHGNGKRSDCHVDCKGGYEVGGLHVPPLLLLHLFSLHTVRWDWRPWNTSGRVPQTDWLWPLRAG